MKEDNDYREERSHPRPGTTVDGAVPADTRGPPVVGNAARGDRTNLTDGPLPSPMFHDAVDDPGGHSPEELYERYEALLVDAVRAVGAAEASERSGVDRETVDALLAGEGPDLTVEEAAALLALDVEEDADTIVALDRDALLMGMTNAVVDVETLARGVDADLEARELQAKVEGRFPMTLREFAAVHRFLEARE